MSFADIINNAAESILDLVYPDGLYCVCCDKMIDSSRPYRLCNECMCMMKWASGRTCGKCGKPLSDSDPLEICYSCREHAHVFDRGYTCMEYGSGARAVVFALKYGERTDIAPTIAEMMHDRLELLRNQGERCEYDLIIPVPMFHRKELRRGFNQAALIAGALAMLEGISYSDKAVVRTRSTGAMKGLDPDARRANLAGAFAVTEPAAVKGLKILLVDDIFTVGATADAVAKVLYDAGAVRVEFITFAAGADMVKE